MDLSKRYINNTFKEEELLILFLILKSFNVIITRVGFDYLKSWGDILYITPHAGKLRLEHNETPYEPYSHYTELTLEELLEYDSRRTT